MKGRGRREVVVVVVWVRVESRPRAGRPPSPAISPVQPRAAVPLYPWPLPLFPLPSSLGCVWVVVLLGLE